MANMKNETGKWQPVLSSQLFRMHDSFEYLSIPSHLHLLVYIQSL
jgi:hypothetical protein